MQASTVTNTRKTQTDSTKKALTVSTNDSMLVGSAKALSIQNAEIHSTNTKEQRLTPELIREHSSQNTMSTLGAPAYSCGSSPSGSSYTTGYQTYPDYSLSLNSTPRGARIDVSVSSFDVPNRFTVKDANGNSVAYAGWMGYATTSGPWGQSLNTSQNQTLSFTTGATSSYSLRVETVVQGTSDAWDASIGCTAPAPQNLNYNQFAIEHNNALDYVHLNYSTTTGPSDFQTVYNKLVTYCNTKGKPLPTLSYQEIINLKSQATNFATLLTAMQNKYNAFTDNEKNEVNTLYQNLSTTTSDSAAQTVLNNFNTRINNSSYSTYEKQQLLGISSVCFTIGDFWSSTTNFMVAPAGALTWQQRAAANPPTGFAIMNYFEEAQNFSMAAVHAHGPNSENYFESDYFGRQCRFWCVWCVALNDAIMMAMMTGAGLPAHLMLLLHGLL